MFPMTVTIHNPEQLNAVMAALHVGGIEPPGAEHCACPAFETAKEEATKTEASAAAPTTAETAQAAAQKPEAPTQRTAGEAKKAPHDHANNPADAPTYQDTAAAITKLARVKGRDAAVAVLAKFGADKLSDVKPELFAAVIAACTEAEA